MTAEVCVMQIFFYYFISFDFDGINMKINDND